MVTDAISMKAYATIYRYWESPVQKQVLTMIDSFQVIEIKKSAGSSNRTMMIYFVLGPAVDATD